MRFEFAILLLFTPIQLWASDCQPHIWSGEGREKVEVCYDSKLDAYLSKSCMNGSCWAKTSLQKKSKMRKTGSEICKSLGGTVLILSDDHQDEASFCEGPDHSVVDLNSLR